MRPGVSYTPYAKSAKEKTGDILTFVKFEEGGLLSGSHNGTESGVKSDDNLTLPPLISEAKNDEMSSSNNLMMNLCISIC